MCREFHADDPHCENDYDARPSFPRGAIGIGAILSTMAVLVRHDCTGEFIDMQEEVLPLRRLPYIIIALFVIKYHGTVLECAQSASKRIRNGVRRSRLSSGNLKKSFSSAEALSRLSRVSSSETLKKLSSTIRNTLKSYTRRAALKSITRKECFAKLDYVGQLSIQDMITLFRYVNDVNQIDFQKKRFMVDQNPLVRSIVTAMDMAVTMSRGHARSIRLSGHRQKGQIDSLYFTAVVRVFAEWRSLRLVPTGYNRYAVGLNLAYRDVLQNLAKIEDGVHAYLKFYANAVDGEKLACPTLRQLVEFELHTNVHVAIPSLKEKSAASGLLWTKRQLHYQTSLFENTLHVPHKYETTQAGVAAAYSEVYDRYHGWAVKQVFAHSFGGSPPLDAIMKQMLPESPEDRKQNTELGFSRSLSDISRDDDSLDNEFLAALEGFGKQVSRKWDDVVRFFNCVDDDGDDEKQSRSQNLILSSESYLDMTGFDSSHLSIVQECPSEDSDDSPIASDPIEGVKAGSLDFVKELRPLIEDIGGLIDEFNMNDPARV